MNIKKLIEKDFIFFDGAMGTMLQHYGLKTGQLPETYNITHPEIVGKIHEEYIKSGADIITANTFGASEVKLQGSIYSVEEIITAGVKLARGAAYDKIVALDIGPIGKLMKPMGEIDFEEAYNIFKRQVIVGQDAGADIILIETMSDLYECKAAILAAKENTSLPIMCTLTFQKDGRTLTGADPLTMVTVLQALGVDALGINCSLGPKELIPIVDEILKYASIPVIVQPNAGLPRLSEEETVFDISAEEFSKYIKFMAQKGVSIFGGCCGTTPVFIKSAKEALIGLKPVTTKPVKDTIVTSGNKAVIIGEEVKVIGERINPTGKKKFKEALKNQDIDYILSEAVLQKKSRADILDVNVGLPEIDEKYMMIKAIENIQSVINLPLQIDSVNPVVIEAAVRKYNGKPIINSVNGKEEVMKDIFPIVKKYGTVVIGLTLDENGIPSKAEERVKIAERIINTANEYDIPKEDILIDCLALTAATQQAEVMETLKAIKMVKEKFGVKTVLGVSNVSFGLPNRAIVNRTYLAMALTLGLDVPIINPMSQDIMDTVNAFKVLCNSDKEAKKFIEAYGEKESNNKIIAESNSNLKKDLKELVIEGLKDESAARTKELLQDKSAMDVVDNYLIPALDIVGERYEKGIIFLPQLIVSAEAVKSAFEVIKEDLQQRGEERISKGKIVLATVKGDIHDIGKNIVKCLLENYGFDIVDLGKDVSADKVVETVKRERIKLVGLSALMTTTVKNMEETIKALKANNLDCITMVGGAVLNEECAKSIGADYYAEDARESVKIAQRVFKV